MLSLTRDSPRQGQVMNQVQGLSRESSQEQQERGPEIELEKRLEHDSRPIQETILETDTPTK